jgi:hypothetical protein
MPVFIPPTVEDVPRVLPDTRGPARLLMRHYRPLPRGRSVVYSTGHYRTVDIPTTDQLTAAGAEGTGWFLGGHSYAVTQAVADVLVADGYTVSADPVVPPRSITWGALAGGTWDDFVDNLGTWG